MYELNLRHYLTPAKYVRSAIGFEGHPAEGFLGMIEDLSIRTNGLVFRTNVYVAKTMDPSYRIILGIPFHIASRMTLLREDDGSCTIILKDEEGNVVEVSAEEAEFARDDGMREMLGASHLGLNAEADGNKTKGHRSPDFEA
jgi:hypothetical protein